MVVPLSVLGPQLAPSFFQEGCRSCPGEDVCGGDSSSPCGCKWTGPRRHQCHICNIVCRERRETAGQPYDDEFRVRLREGLSVDQIGIDQPHQLETPPLLIPLRTRNLTVEDGALLSWGAVNLEGLLSLSKDNLRVRLRQRTSAGPEGLRKALKLSPESHVLAVLNGKDEALEALWPHSTRSDLITALRDAEVTGVTGPTFSVYGEEPSSHRVYMMMRHHKMVQEIHDAGLLSVPNLYWREGDPRDIALWGEYLRATPEVRWVSRDFSRDKNLSTFEPHLDGLLQIVRRAARPLHIFVLTGPTLGAYAVRRLGEAGCTCSIVTARPVLAGIKGRSLVPNSGGFDERLVPGTARGSALALNNMRRVEKALISVARRVGVAPQPRLSVETPSPSL